jgi:molecular chaperone GrpE
MDSKPTPGFTVRDRRFWASVDDAVSTASKPAAEAPATDGAGTSSDAGATEGRSAEYPTYVEQLRADLAEKDRLLREYIAAYKQEVTVGIEETRARLKRDADKQLEVTRGQLVEGLLEVLDNLDRCVASAQAATEPQAKALVDGVRLVRDQFLQKLYALGLQRVDTQGLAFDPKVHEAIGSVPVNDPQDDGRIVTELRAGFLLGERLLRPALVQIGRRT